MKSHDKSQLFKEHIASVPVGRYTEQALQRWGMHPACQRIGGAIASSHLNRKLEAYAT